jgi:hypothetical protein
VVWPKILRELVIKLLSVSDCCVLGTIYFAVNIYRDLYIYIAGNTFELLCSGTWNSHTPKTSITIQGTATHSGILPCGVRSSRSLLRCSAETASVFAILARNSRRRAMDSGSRLKASSRPARHVDSMNRISTPRKRTCWRPVHLHLSSIASINNNRDFHPLTIAVYAQHLYVPPQRSQPSTALASWAFQTSCAQ